MLTMTPNSSLHVHFVFCLFQYFMCLSIPLLVYLSFVEREKNVKKFKKNKKKKNTLIYICDMLQTTKV